ncbi:MAG: hypothetical protein WBQ89_12360 [Candidatus Acidiferrum sp.]
MEIRIIQPFLHYFGSVRERTMHVARCVPADKIDWSYSPGKFTLRRLAAAHCGHGTQLVRRKHPRPRQPLYQPRPRSSPMDERLFWS